MIFVTVGTHEQPFNRLLQWMDELVESHLIQEEVVIQTGYSTYEPKYCTHQKLFSYSEMETLVKEARIVITHGGPSSFLMVLQEQKVPIVVPRKMHEKEHVNDHQVKFVREVEKRLHNILLVETLGALKDTISHYDEKVKLLEIDSMRNNDQFNQQLEGIVDELFPEAEIGVAMITANLEVQGISNVIMQYAKNIDTNHFSVTILAGEEVAEVYEQQCEELGISIIKLPHRKKHSIRYLFQLKKELKQGYFDLVHVHGNQASMAAELFVAWWCGIGVRFAHSHNSTCEHILMHKVLQPFFKLLYTKPIACGRKAGEWLYPNQDFTVLPNGFLVEQFRFNFLKREEIRTLIQTSMLGHINDLDHPFIIGHVGCFNHQKNHPFILEVFEHIANKNKNAILILIGSGPEYVNVEKLVNRHPYKNQIVLLGEIQNVSSWYMAMDVFLFPSKYEGVPLALLEAQVSGLPCVVSDEITTECFLSEHVQAISLDEEKEKWAEAVLNMEKVNREEFFDRYRQKIDSYQIKNTVRFLEVLYRNEVEKN